MQCPKSVQESAATSSDRRTKHLETERMSSAGDTCVEETAEGTTGTAGAGYCDGDVITPLYWS